MSKELVATSHEMTLNEMSEDAHANSRAKGWYEGEEKRNIGEMLMLIVSEAAEAMEDYRNDKMEMWFEPKPGGINKPCGFPSEIADIVIRCGDLCGHLGIDLQAAVTEKMAYNATRPHRHGGKRA